MSVVAVTGNGFSIKEKIFIAIAWLPKATVQVYVQKASFNCNGYGMYCIIIILFL